MPTIRYRFKEARSFRRGRIRPIQNIILHSTDGHEEGDIATLTRGAVSVHWYVTKDGRIFHFVQDRDTAFHAGVVVSAAFSNASTIGIEQEHIDGAEEWQSEQIETVARLTAFLLQRHHLDIGDIHTHAHVAFPPGRKQDPLHYPFDRFFELVQQNLDVEWDAEEIRD